MFVNKVFVLLFLVLSLSLVLADDIDHLRGRILRDEKQQEKELRDSLKQLVAHDSQLRESISWLAQVSPSTLELLGTSESSLIALAGTNLTHKALHILDVAPVVALETLQTYAKKRQSISQSASASASGEARFANVVAKKGCTNYWVHVTTQVSSRPPPACPPGPWTLSSDGSFCTSGWSTTWGQSNAQAACQGAGYAFPALDFSDHPYTCYLGTECPDGPWTLSADRTICTSGWSTTWGQANAQAACQAEGYTFPSLDFSDNPYTCDIYTATTGPSNWLTWTSPACFNVYHSLLSSCSQGSLAGTSSSDNSYCYNAGATLETVCIGCLDGGDPLCYDYSNIGYDLYLTCAWNQQVGFWAFSSTSTPAATNHGGAPCQCL